jgi:hypothetical protein
MMVEAEKNYEYRRGSIAVVDRSSGLFVCLECGTGWWAMLRSGGYYCRGSWTCHHCGASSKGQGKKGAVSNDV